MTGIPPINPMMPGLGIVPPPIPPDMPAVKEIIHCKSCTLFPPNPRNCLLVLCLYRISLCLCLCLYKPHVCVRKGPFLRLTAGKRVTATGKSCSCHCLPFPEIAFSLPDVGNPAGLRTGEAAIPVAEWVKSSWFAE